MYYFLYYVNTIYFTQFSILMELKSLQYEQYSADISLNFLLSIFLICTRLVFNIFSLLVWNRYSGVLRLSDCVLLLRMRRYVKTGIWSVLFASLQLWKLEMLMFMSPIYYALHRSSAFPYLVWNKFKTREEKCWF